MGLAEDILNANDLEREEISLPKWSSDPLYVYMLNGTERDAFEASIVETRGSDTVQNLQNLRAKLAVRCLRDKDGNRVFRDDQADALGKKSSVYLDQIFAKARKLNRFSKEDVEELVGNSSAAPSGDSTSD